MNRDAAACGILCLTLTEGEKIFLSLWNFYHYIRCRRMTNMKIVLFDTKNYDKKHFDAANMDYGFEIVYLEPALNAHSAVMAKGADVVCPFVNCTVDRTVIDILSQEGVRLIAMRSAGFNNVDYQYANEKGIPVVRVPAYSPHAVAEHSFALLLALVRKLTHAYVRTREFNFSLSGLVGMDLYGKTFGVVGTGKIGRVAIGIAKGFGMKVLAYDPYPAKDPDVQYTDLDTLLREADVVSLYCPLTKENRHMINAATIDAMKDTAFLINTSRGALIDSEALVEALKEKKLGGAALDVYEEEAGIFYTDQSSEGIEDDTLARLISMPNAIITSHQGYLTEEALSAISGATLANVKEFEEGKTLTHQVK